MSGWLRRVGGVVVALLIAEVTVRGLVLAPGVTLRMLRVQWADTGAELHWYREWVVSHLPGLADARDGSWAATTYDPLLGWVPRAGFAEIDARGLRDAGLARAPGARRVVVVGDSFAFGHDVAVDEAWYTELERRHAGLDLLVLAAPGYGLDQVVLRTERDAPALAPEVVVLVAIGIDVPRALARFISYAKPRFTLDEGELVLHGVPLPEPAVMVRRVALRPRTLDLLRVYAEGRSWQNVMDGPRGPEAYALNEALLDRWVSAVRSMGAEPLVVVLPTPDELGHLREGRDVSIDEFVHQFFVRWCARQDFACLDRFAEVDARVGDIGAFQRTGHWSPSGNLVVADVMEAVLAERGLLGPAK